MSAEWLTEDEVRAMLGKVQEAVDAGDYEVAHAAEDDLFVAVLGTLTFGLDESDAAQLARIALAARDIDYPRWYA